MSLSNVDLQRLLSASKYYSGGLDGDIGDKTINAALSVLKRHKDKLPSGWDKWQARRKIVAAVQIILLYAGYEPGQIDGYDGHNTLEAYRAWDFQTLTGKKETINREPPKDGGQVKNSEFPAQSKCDIFYGKPGSSDLISQLKMYDLPLEMRIDYNLNQKTNKVQLHEKCGSSGISIFEQTIRHYGEKEWRRLGLDRNAGTYNHRKMRGGTSWSMHAYGCAWDLYAGPNGLRVPAPKALFSKPDYIPFFNIVEAHGWLSLGRTINRDWMHIQATSSLK